MGDCSWDADEGDILGARTDFCCILSSATPKRICGFGEDLLLDGYEFFSAIALSGEIDLESLFKNLPTVFPAISLPLIYND
jgi:hypothetical protein